MSIRETFSNSISFTVINKYNKGAVMQISTVFGQFTMLLVQRCSETGLFKHLFNDDFGIRNLGNAKPMWGILF